MEVIRLADIGSTNDYLLSLNTQEEVCAVTDYQSAGKGMGGNTWESEAGKNLLFSILVHPVWLPVAEQYLMSMAEALALHDALRATIEPQLGAEAVAKLTIKWPNDIYWEDWKLSGTRIDCNISGGRLQDVVIGTGINVNQREFRGTAPNPVSLWQIGAREYDREALLQEILRRFEVYAAMLRDGGSSEIVRLYHERLYRRTGFHWYKDKDGAFEAELVRVKPNGMMVLRGRDGTMREYEVKEVTPSLPQRGISPREGENK